MRLHQATVFVVGLFFMFLEIHLDCCSIYIVYSGYLRFSSPDFVLKLVSKFRVLVKIMSADFRLIPFSSQYHHFKWWFDNAPIRGQYLQHLKGGAESLQLAASR